MGRIPFPGVGRATLASVLAVPMGLLGACGRSELPTSAEGPLNGNSESITSPRVASDRGKPIAAIPPSTAASEDSSQTRTVILISIDGLAPRFLEEQLEAGLTPNFARLKKNALFTHNAHTEHSLTVTLPNHTSMLTGRPVAPPPNAKSIVAHGVTANHDTGGVVHEFGTPPQYVTSIFDIVHDRGGCTGFFAGKDKLLVIARAYDEEHGRSDLVDEDNGKNKIDHLLIEPDTPLLLSQFNQALTHVARNCAGRRNFLFLHFRDTDSHGHASGWGSPAYLNALTSADYFLGRVLDTVLAIPQLRDTVVMLTADHGGTGTGHYDQLDPNVFRIPFYVWTHGGSQGDLYVRGEGRVDPDMSGPTTDQRERPLRNGDAANLSLRLLGLPEIPGSYHRGFQVDLSSMRPLTEP